MVEAALPNPGGGDPIWGLVVSGILFVTIAGAWIVIWLRRRKG